MYQDGDENHQDPDWKDENIARRSKEKGYEPKQRMNADGNPGDRETKIITSGRRRLKEKHIFS
jgi:hypothetical protein